MKEALCTGALRRVRFGAALGLLLLAASRAALASDTVDVEASGNDSPEAVTETLIVSGGSGSTQAVPEAQPGSDIEPLDITPEWDITRFDISRYRTPSDPSALVQYLSEHYRAGDAQLGLDEAVRIAVASNHDLNSKRLYALASCQGKAIIWADLNPQLSLQADAHHTWSDSKVAGQDDSSVESVALNLTKRIYDFGLTRDLLEANAAQTGIKHYSVSMAEQQLVAAVASAYFSFSLALGELRIREDELALSQKFLTQAEIQFNVGTVPKLDVIRAEARVQQAEAALNTAQAGVGDSAAYFYSLLGVEDARYVPQVVTADLLDLGAAPPDISMAEDSAINCRPEIQIQYNTFFAGESKIDLTRNRPILEAYASGRWSDPETVQGNVNGTLGLQLNWNLYTGGKDKASKTQAQTELRAISEAILDLEAKLELDATQSWNSLVKLRANTIAARKNLDLSGEALRVAAIGYGAGVTPYIDYESALNNNVAAALGYLISLVQVKQAQLDLLRAQGFPAGYPGQGGNSDSPCPGIEAQLAAGADASGWASSDDEPADAQAEPAEDSEAQAGGGEGVASIQQP